MPRQIILSITRNISNRKSTHDVHAKRPAVEGAKGLEDVPIAGRENREEILGAGHDVVPLEVSVEI